MNEIAQMRRSSIVELKRRGKMKVMNRSQRFSKYGGEGQLRSINSKRIVEKEYPYIEGSDHTPTYVLRSTVARRLFDL